MMALREFGAEWATHIVEVGVLLTLTGFALAWVRHRIGLQWVRRVLGRDDAVGLLSGAALGAVTPVCSCSVGAVYASLLHNGASTRSAAAFLFAAPAVNEVVIVAVLLAFGAAGAGIYVVAGLAAATLTGRFAERLHLRPCASCAASMRRDWPDETQSIWHRAMADTRGLVTTMALPVAVGAAIAAALHVWSWDPASVMSGVGDAAWAPVAAAVVGLPLHVEPGMVAALIVPLASSGIALGTLISLTMATTVASMPEGAMLKTIVGWRGVGTLAAWYLLYTSLIGVLVNTFWS
ncbi:MAG: hypothetical protein FJW21_00025 [Acidimicrobiia bacterium]|nr:hypothetical protein [Acidimicrobiia bacterium]